MRNSYTSGYMDFCDNETGLEGLKSYVQALESPRYKRRYCYWIEMNIPYSGGTRTKHRLTWEPRT
jgi:hypothetical protein